MDGETATFSQHDGVELLEGFRKSRATEGERRDCLQVWVALPDEGRFAAAATCIHRRALIGPPGTVERFVVELDQFVTRFGAAAHRSADVAPDRRPNRP